MYAYPMARRTKQTEKAAQKVKSSDIYRQITIRLARRSFSSIRVFGIVVWLVALTIVLVDLYPTAAEAQQTLPRSAQSEDAPASLSTLRFINPRDRVALPEPMPGPVLRFVVADDFPPFAFVDGAGRLAGLHIGLIRAICSTLDLPCTVQARRFDQVLSAVDEDPDNLVLAAGLAISEELGGRLTFSLPYYRYAGRFISLRAASNDEDWINQARIGVLENTAHAAFLRDAYADATVETYPSSAALFQALRRGDVSHAFGDGVDLAFWLAGRQSGDCCHFVGPPLFSLTYFGEGLALAVPRGQPQLIQALNAAIARLEASGELETLMLTAFPIDPFGL